PTTQRESRKARSSSPITTIFFGSPSGSGSSSDSSTGSQKRRSSSPIGVPAADSVRKALSSARSIAVLPRLLSCLVASLAQAKRSVNAIERTAQRRASRLDVGPALFLELHDVHDAGLHQLRLWNELNVLVLGLVHVLLGISERLEGNPRRAQRHRLDPR